MPSVSETSKPCIKPAISVSKHSPRDSNRNWSGHCLNDVRISNIRVRSTCCFQFFFSPLIPHHILSLTPTLLQKPGSCTLIPFSLPSFIFFFLFFLFPLSSSTSYYYHSSSICFSFYSPFLGFLSVLHTVCLERGCHLSVHITSHRKRQPCHAPPRKIKSNSIIHHFHSKTQP